MADKKSVHKRSVPIPPVVLTVRAGEAGWTLQDVLARRQRLSRNRAKALIDSRGVLVNAQRVWMARHALQAGDRIEIVGSPGLSRAALPCPVLYRDGDYLVVNKPAGITANGPHSVESRLRAELALPALLAVHRLDRDTSGCLLLALNRPAFEAALPLFRQRAVAKTYHAVVSGQLSPPERIIDAPVEGERAITRVRTLSSSGAASHVCMQIETGRTHQIRKHLAGIRHPVLGDRQYGGRTPVPAGSLRLSRQMLHASALELENPLSGAPIRAHAPLPADFRRCLHSYRLA